MAIEKFQVLRQIFRGAAAHAGPLDLLHSYPALPGLSRKRSNCSSFATRSLSGTRFSPWVRGLYLPLPVSILRSSVSHSTLSSPVTFIVIIHAFSCIRRWPQAVPPWTRGLASRLMGEFLKPSNHALLPATLVPIPAFPPSASRSFLLRPSLIVEKLPHPSRPQSAHGVRSPPDGRRI